MGNPADQAESLPSPGMGGSTGEERSLLRRAAALKIAVPLAMGTGVLLSYPLWHTHRLFPPAPVWEALPELPVWLAFSLPIFLLLLCGVILVLRQPWPALAAFLGLVAFLVLFDLNRLQPWVYQYGFTAAALACLYHSVPETRKMASALHACRFLLCAAYVWAGIQKLNKTFVTRTFALTLGPAFPDVGDSAAVRAMAVSVPLLEVMTGVLLLLPRTRKLGMVLAAGLHGAILVLLGPLREVNSVVWPWNAAMIAFVIILFRDSRDAGVRDLLVPKTPLHGAALLLFGLMPALSLVGAWDSYLSFKLYSGNTARAFITVARRENWDWPERYRPFLKNSRTISVEEWALKELNVPPYPQERTYRQVMRRLWLDAGRPSALQLVVEGEPGILSGKRSLVHLSPSGQPVECDGCRHGSAGDDKK